MKVLLINGSPHEKGCTYTALAEVASALEKEGIETEILQIGSGDVRGCMACGGCSQTGRCVFGDEDRVNEAIEKMEQADGLVIGSPVHYASPAGAMLSFLDRMFYAGSEAFAHKPGACVVSARRAGTTASLDVLTKYITISQMPLVSSCYWNMVHGSNAEQVAQDKEGLQVMRTLGANMAWLLRCIQTAKEHGVEPPAQEKRIFTNFIR
ncbi:MAG: flavodoxin family protein [Clostridia bacterium]|nr:flavodoxin family protein [Clostridia bacterium]